jgi:hypothetical protein
VSLNNQKKFCLYLYTQFGFDSVVWNTIPYNQAESDFNATKKTEIKKKKSIKKEGG